MSVRYAVIGAGMMGVEHIRNLALIDGASLTAIADPNHGSLENAGAVADGVFGAVDRHEDPAALIKRDDIDAFIVATPNHTHAEIAQMVMRSAKPFLLEKPMCATEKDARSLHQQSLSYQPMIWVGLEYRYMPPVARFIDYAHDGVVGPIKMLSIREHRFPFLPKVDAWNRFNRNSGGTLVEKCCHFFDLMRFILRDEPTRLFASGGQDVNHLDERYDGETPDVLDNAFVVVDFRRGARAVLDLCMFAEGSPEQEEIHVAGPKGKLSVSIPSGAVSWHPRDRIDPWVKTIDVPPAILAAGDHHGATYYQLQRFHRRVLEAGAPEVSAFDGLRSVQMGVAAQRSIETGEAVQLADPVAVAVAAN